MQYGKPSRGGITLALAFAGLLGGGRDSSRASTGADSDAGNATRPDSKHTGTGSRNRREKDQANRSDSKRRSHFLRPAQPSDRRKRFFHAAADDQAEVQDRGGGVL